jgi:hypothetical protein
MQRDNVTTRQEAATRQDSSPRTEAGVRTYVDGLPPAASYMLMADGTGYPLMADGSSRITLSGS